MTLTNTLAKLRNATTGVVELPSLTSTLRANGDIGPSDTVMVQIRKVKAAEIVADTGSTPLMLAVLKERRQGETQEQFRARLSERIGDDPSAIQDTQRLILATQEAVIIHGVTALAIGTSGVRPEWEALKLERTGERSIDLLGDDAALVHDRIVEFSNLPYQRLGGAGATSFPEQQAGADSQPGGGELRDDPQPVPEPPAG